LNPSSTDASLKPRPMPDADTGRYWEGIREGRLLLQHCTACGHVQLYQQSRCRACGSDALVHRAASGRARVHSFSVVHRAPGPAFKADTPYAVLLVDLAEGPRMISGYSGDDPSEVDFDMEVELVCEADGDGRVLPMFRAVRS
jgi:uncharacterized protein